VLRSLSLVSHSSVPAVNGSPSGAAARQQVLADEAIQALVLDYSGLPKSVRFGFAFSREEQLAWLRAAAAEGVSLVVVCEATRISMYSTQGECRRAFRAVLQTLATRRATIAALGSLAVVDKTELLAARHLLERASGLEGDGEFSATAGAAIQTAASLAASSTALGPTLSALFRAAGNVTRRIRLETELGTAQSSPAWLSIEGLSAARIVEEELAAWQAQEAEALRAKAEVRAAEVAELGYAQEEPASLTRLRASLRAQNSDRERSLVG